MNALELLDRSLEKLESGYAITPEDLMAIRNAVSLAERPPLVKLTHAETLVYRAIRAGAPYPVQIAHISDVLERNGMSGTTNVVQVHVCRMRKKIAKLGQAIESDHSGRYIFVENTDAD